MGFSKGVLVCATWTGLLVAGMDVGRQEAITLVVSQLFVLTLPVAVAVFQQVKARGSVRPIRVVAERVD